MHVLGIEIGGSKLQLVAGTGDGSILDRRRLTVDPSAGGAGIRRMIAEALPDLIRRWNPGAVGVGFGGPVDWRRGTIRCSHQIDGWADFPLGAWLKERVRFPVRIDNDANVATLGEARRGAGVERNPVFYVTLGSGVGGGLVVDGRIYHGAIPGEAEMGHVRLDRSGVTVEQRCSGWAVDRRIRAEVETHPESKLAALCSASPGAEARHLGPALAAGDELARRILGDVADDLAYALSHAVHLVHPEVIVLGGGLSLVGPALSSAVAARLPQYLMDSFRPGPEVTLARLLEDAVPAGALILAAGSGA